MAQETITHGDRLHLQRLYRECNILLYGSLAEAEAVGYTGGHCCMRGCKERCDRKKIVTFVLSPVDWALRGVPACIDAGLF